jgi:hypothetical protein
MGEDTERKTMIELSYSSSADARSCNRKFYYRNILRLEPKKISSALTIGTVLHGCFDLLFQGKDKNEIATYINNSFAEAVSNTMDPSQAERFTIDKFIVLGMWNNYPFSDMEFDKVYPEQSFKVRLGNMRGMCYKGRVDGLVIRNGRPWIREVKTTSMDRRQFQSKSNVSYQAAGYMYGIQKSMGMKTEGVVYDVIKKPLLRRRVNETTDDFAKRIYEDYCDPTKKEFYFDRFFSYRTAKEIEEFEKDMILLARDIRTRIGKNIWYRNTDSCYQFNSECPFKQICWIDKPDEGLINSLYDRRKVNG